MVYHTQSKRRKPAKPHHKISLELPDELWEHVTSYMATSDVLKLRATHPRLTPVCSTVVQRRLTCLYIHPSKSSLRAAIDICHHPLFGQIINEVVILGKVDFASLPCHGSCLRYDHSQSCCNQKSICRPWPSSLPAPRSTTSAKVEGLARAGISNSADTPFALAYEPLIRALQALPKLVRLSAAESVATPGLNAISQSLIDSHAKKHSSAESPSSKYSRGPTSRCDAEVVFAVLTSPKLHLTKLAIASELPFRLELASLSNDFFAQLTDIELHFDSHWQVTLWQQRCGDLLRSAHALKNLRIIYRPNGVPPRARTRDSLSAVLSNQQWATLESLELISLPSTSHETRPERPMCQEFDLADFVKRHCGSLKKLHIDNVLVCGPMLSSVDALRELMRVTTEHDSRAGLSVWVNRFEHHPRCKKADTATTQDCRAFDCGLYDDQFTPTALHRFETLAPELDVALIASGRTWDFGAYVQRVRKLRHHQ